MACKCAREHERTERVRAWNTAQFRLDCGGADGDHLHAGKFNVEGFGVWYGGGRGGEVGRGGALGCVGNLDALLDHLLAERDGEGVHCSCGRW